MTLTALAGARIVLADRVAEDRVLVLDGARIVGLADAAPEGVKAELEINPNNLF